MQVQIYYKFAVMLFSASSSFFEMIFIYTHFFENQLFSWKLSVANLKWMTQNMKNSRKYCENTLLELKKMITVQGMSFIFVLLLCKGKGMSFFLLILTLNLGI